MTLRLLFAIIACVCGVLLIFVDVKEPGLVTGVGIICAALAAVIDR